MTFVPANLPVIEVKQVAKTVKLNDEELNILRPASFAIYPKETLAILGASGSGKSTLLSLLAGLDLPSEGEIYLASNPIHKMSEDQRAQVRAQHIGFIFQSFMLVQSLTALENVTLPMELAGIDNATEQAKALLDSVGLNNRLSHFPNQLSGGEQQRVAIARAFACKPDILFADEPTGNLDLENGKKVQNLLFDLNKEFGTTLVLVTHDLKLADLCARKLHIHGGVIAEAINGDKPSKSNRG
ncbi:ATP-binding cassette domain-containing protein [Catenovulum sp. SM1970]|uniref:ABC transporter ATP-binding protein n=1 Tax=Marinifaba aquimaris TaxID=2741323 RepID=UPI0015743954|nr:ATP-binding cassette domain-containing protein [Marinifaba aquimaris]NTS78077.1 ATP-binding cassette domain-containing protein [Marinifaba aquimaris]